MYASGSPSIPLGWEWAENILSQYNLPILGMPVKWDQTQEKHQRIAYDPRTRNPIDLNTGKRMALRSIDFITATKGKNIIHGTEEPAAVRVERYQEPCFHDHFITDASGNTLAPCIAHGDYVKVESLAADHLQAKENIFKRQAALVEKLNQDFYFASFLMKQPGMEKFFVEHQGQYYGTLFYYEVYFNDIDNIWLICDACNSKKSNQDTFDWFESQWLYGQEFLDYLARQAVQTEGGILVKTSDQRGLAEVAIAWFWERHANYVSISKRIQEDIVVPLNILNIKADRIVGHSSTRGHRLEASLNARLMFIESIVRARGLGMPKMDGESDHASSEDLDRMSPIPGIKVTPGGFNRAAGRVREKLASVAKSIFKDELTEEYSTVVDTDDRESTTPIPKKTTQRKKT